MNKIFYLLLTLSFTCFAQNETSNWYFGDKAGIKFDKATPVVVNNGQMNTPAGCSSISDNEGNLLFYTNGNTVWNSNHEILENGDGLAGDPEHTQSSIIIPKPNDSSIYYIFTTRKNQIPGVVDGLYFHEVTINSSNPFGKITNKNRRLNSFAAEKITAVHSADSKSIWVITLSSKNASEKDKINTFYTYKVTDNGVNPIPFRKFFYDTEPSYGTLKASPNGKKIILTTPGRLHFFDFDNTNGNITPNNSVNTAINLTQGYTVYAAEFSPDSNYIYYTAFKYGVGPPTYTVNQYDLNSDDIFQIGYPLKLIPNLFPGAIQLASNGKIYIVYHTNGSSTVRTIGVINSPNKKESLADYSHIEIDLVPNNPIKGLPNFISSYFRNRIITENQCVFDLFNFSLDSYTPITSVFWDFGDGNTSTDTSPSHTYSNSGRYTVTATIIINGQTNYVYKDVTVYPLPVFIKNQKLSQCDDDTDGISLFNLKNIEEKISTDTSLTYKYYKGLSNAQNEVNEIIDPENFYNESNPQTLYVKATTIHGCKDIESFSVETIFKPSISIPPMIECENLATPNNSSFDLKREKVEIDRALGLTKLYKISFFPSFNDAQRSTNELPEIFESSSRTIWVKIENENECSGISPITLIVNKLPEINLNDTYTICIEPLEHAPIILTTDPSSDRFEWKNNSGEILSTSNTFELKSIGNYSLTLYKIENGIECSNSKEFTVINPNPPSFSLIDVNVTNESNNTIFISVQGNSSYEFSLDNINYFGNGLSYTFSNITPGVQNVYVRDLNNCEATITSKTSIIGYPKFFTPNADGTNDIWKIYGANSNFFKEINVRIFNRFGKTLHIINNTNIEQGWDGTYKGQPLTSNNYWFYAKLVDFKGNIIEKKGSFSLVRK